MREPHMTSAPPAPDFSMLPATVDRKGAAELITKHLFPVSPRTLERWPVVGRVVNGRLVFSTTAIYAHAKALWDAAPAMRGGTKQAA